MMQLLENTKRVKTYQKEIRKKNYPDASKNFGATMKMKNMEITQTGLMVSTQFSPVLKKKEYLRVKFKAKLSIVLF